VSIRRAFVQVCLVHKVLQQPLLLECALTLAWHARLQDT